MANGDPAVQRPLPVDARQELLGDLSHLALGPRVGIEIPGRGQDPREKDRRVDGRELRSPCPSSGLDVDEVIEEPLVSGGVDFGPLRALPEETERLESAIAGAGAGDESSRGADRIARESQAHTGNAGGCFLVGVVADETVLWIRLLPEVLEGALLELGERLLIEHSSPTRFAHPGHDLAS